MGKTYLFLKSNIWGHNENPLLVVENKKNSGDMELREKGDQVSIKASIWFLNYLSLPLLVYA